MKFCEIVPQVYKIKNLRVTDRETTWEWNIEHHDWMSLKPVRRRRTRRTRRRKRRRKKREGGEEGGGKYKEGKK